MKKLQLFMLITTLLVLATLPVAAQTYVDPGSLPLYLETPISSAKAYANSQIDTTSAFVLGGATKLSYVYYGADSTSLRVYLDFQIVGASSWTLKDSTTITTTAAGYSEWVVRDGITDKVPGIAIKLRLRRAFQGSANGVTSASYSDKWCWKP